MKHIIAYKVHYYSIIFAFLLISIVAILMPKENSDEKEIVEFLHRSNGPDKILYYSNISRGKEFEINKFPYIFNYKISPNIDYGRGYGQEYNYGFTSDNVAISNNRDIIISDNKQQAINIYKLDKNTAEPIKSIKTGPINSINKISENSRLFEISKYDYDRPLSGYSQFLYFDEDLNIKKIFSNNSDKYENKLVNKRFTYYYGNSNYFIKYKNIDTLPTRYELSDEIDDDSDDEIDYFSKTNTENFVKNTHQESGIIDTIKLKSINHIISFINNPYMAYGIGNKDFEDQIFIFSIDSSKKFTITDANGFLNQQNLYITLDPNLYDSSTRIVIKDFNIYFYCIKNDIFSYSKMYFLDFAKKFNSSNDNAYSPNHLEFNNSKSIRIKEKRMISNSKNDIEFTTNNAYIINYSTGQVLKIDNKATDTTYNLFDYSVNISSYNSSKNIFDNTGLIFFDNVAYRFNRYSFECIYGNSKIDKMDSVALTQFDYLDNIPNDEYLEFIGFFYNRKFPFVHIREGRDHKLSYNYFNDSPSNSFNLFKVEKSPDIYVIIILIFFIISIYVIGLIFIGNKKISLSFFESSEIYNLIPSLADKVSNIINNTNELKLRSNRMLSLGIIFGVLGVVSAILIFSMEQNTIYNSWTEPKLIFKILRPTILLVFIESFSIFFLKQYRVIFNEYKLFYSIYLKIYNYYHIIEISCSKIPTSTSKQLSDKLLNEVFDIYNKDSNAKVNEFDSPDIIKLIEAISKIKEK